MLQLAKTTSADVELRVRERDAALGLTPQNALGQSVQVAGQTLKIIGIFDDAKWSGNNGLRDLDDELFTPVNYQDQQNKQASAATRSRARAKVRRRKCKVISTWKRRACC